MTDVNTDAPKKSFLTIAMENVRAKTTANETDEKEIATTNEDAAKRLLKKLAISAAVTIAAGTALTYALKRAAREMTDVESVDETDEN